MQELTINNKNNVYEIFYKSSDKEQTFKIYNSLAKFLNKTTQGNELKKYEKPIVEKISENNATCGTSAEAIARLCRGVPLGTNSVQTLIDNSFYDINTNRYINNPSPIKNNAIDYNICPLAPFKNTIWALVSTVYLKTFYKNENLQSEYKEAILKELEKRGYDKNDLLNSKNINVDNNKSELTKAEINKRVYEISRGRDYLKLSDEELKKIAEIDIFDNTAQSILKGRDFNKRDLLVLEIEKGRKLSDIPEEDLIKIKEITPLERYKKQIEEELESRKNNKNILIENEKGIIEFGEEQKSIKQENTDSDYILEDPLTDSIYDWDYDAYVTKDRDGNIIDEEGNKLLFISHDNGAKESGND